MKVLCIDASNQRNDNTDDVVEGEIYTVIEIRDNGKDIGYLLKEKNSPVGYLQKRFIPLSSIDETELIKERENTLQEV